MVSILFCERNRVDYQLFWQVICSNSDILGLSGGSRFLKCPYLFSWKNSKLTNISSESIYTFPQSLETFWNYVPLTPLCRENTPIHRLSLGSASHQAISSLSRLLSLVCSSNLALRLAAGRGTCRCHSNTGLLKPTKDTQSAASLNWTTIQWTRKATCLCRSSWVLLAALINVPSQLLESTGWSRTEPDPNSDSSVKDQCRLQL